jgi:hypothetical protein
MDVAPKTVRLDDAAFAGLKTVGTATDGGSEGRASVDFAPTTGRYVMVRWMPASQQDRSFTLAEVAAFGPGRCAPRGKHNCGGQRRSQR